MLKIYARKDHSDLHQTAYDLLLYGMKHDFGFDRSELEINRDEQGKPYFLSNPYHFSITHTDGLAIVAISDVPVGIDAERDDRIISDKLAKRFLHSDSATVEDWTRYEGLGKMLGCGIPLTKEQMAVSYFHRIYRSVPGYVICCVTRLKQECDQILIV